MDRRDFLKSTGGAAVAAAAGVVSASTLAADDALAAPALSTGVRTVTLAAPWEKIPTGYADDALRLARRIEAACEGVLRVDLVTADGPIADTDMTLALVHRHVTDHPAFAFFAGLPGETGLSATDLDGWLIAGGGQSLWDELAAELGIKPLLAGHTGADPVLWSRRRISSLDDLSNLPLFTRGLSADVARGLGALPVALEEAAVAPAIAAGGIDAAEWGSLVQASAIALPAAMPFGLKGAFGRGGAALALDVKLSIWERLTSIEKSAITAAASAEFRTTLAEERAVLPMIEAAVRARFGARIARPSPDLAAAMERIAAAVVAHAAGHDVRANRINASYLMYRRSISARGHDEALSLV